ncbi:hypothetical protein [Glycomyces salinus]|uniref:hypothetical protein n=1 Tax=Glycomyces salinus TaxID=980294 RepID=UPI0018EBC095|nr:hypothetical protein [Glycomyces salinus]
MEILFLLVIALIVWVVVVQIRKGQADGESGDSEVRPSPPHRSSGGRRMNAALGANRKLRTDLTADETLKLLESLIETYRPRKYPEFPHVTPASAEVRPGTRPPDHFVEISDAADEMFFLAIWEEQSTCEMGLFALDQKDLNQTTLIGNWKMRDGSLTSIGRFDAGTIGLRAPQIPPDYVQEILTAGGRPVTPANVAALTEHLALQFVVKAHQFVSGTPSMSAEAFADRHRPVQSIDDIQRMLDDLATIRSLVAYIQDVPWRLRAIILHNTGPGTRWDEMPD